MKHYYTQGISRGTDISIEALSNTGGTVTVCAFVVDDNRDGQWDAALPADGFTVSSTTFEFTNNGSITGNMRTYCKVLPTD